MLYFLYGEDSFRSKSKLSEMIGGYKEVHKSGLNLIYIDAKENDFKDFYVSIRTNSMFSEKKLAVLKNIFSDSKFQEKFLENIDAFVEAKDIIVIYEETSCDQRTKLFKELKKKAKAQEFEFLQPAVLKKWAGQQFDNKGVKIDADALSLLFDFVKSDLWRMSNEVAKLANYKKGSSIKKEDVELLIKPNIENDIFKTIEALASKNKKLALVLLRKHIDNGDNALYLLSMFAYQFKSLLIIKQLQDSRKPYPIIVKKSGLHPFVVQKNSHLSNQFSFTELKKIYRKIFQIDFDIKTGKIEPELALDLLVSGI